MKISILCLSVLTLGLCLSANNKASVQPTCVHAQAACRVDDPPPEPVECPFCGGNAQLHARRLTVIQEHIDCVALMATRW
jgi:hypothetical protein